MTRHFWAALAAAFLATGCATKDAPPRDSTPALSSPEADKQKDAADSSREESEHASLDSASMPPLEAAPPPGEERGEAERFDVSARKVPVREVLLGLVEGTQHSVVINPEVSGEVTLNLRSVTVAEALDFLSRTYGYGVEQIGNRFLIRPAALQTRTFRINYLNVSRKGSSQTQISSGQVTQSGAMGNAQSGGNTGDGVIGSEIKTSSSADFWDQLRSGLEAILEGGPSEKDRLVMHPGAGVVLVRAMPNTLHQVADYLEAVEGGSHRQVIIEAKVLEVQLNKAHESGINWATLGSSGEGRLATRLGSTSSGGATVGEALEQGASPPALLPQLQGINPDGFFSAAFSLDNFSAVLSLLETQGDVNVLSSPRVATVNNQKAVIKVGVDEFFLTDVELQNTATTGVTTQQQNFDVELTPFFDGIALDVTPQISKNGMVTLHVHPSVTEVTSQQKQFQFSNEQVFQFPLARSDVRESDSIVRARDGEIVVIGGLMSDSNTDSQTRVPVLGSIPLLGALFRHEERRQTKRELVILLRPRIVHGKPVKDGRQEALQRIWDRGLRKTAPDG
ncbi:pilus (MSHA type) biogenesis protein MshL [Thiohalorhabdus methylotrophus]|uniref:Pilus (MSHA type) biogenesis protein MshL n=1 Tax=Thiohalorhabdus methylotrophus TaxID=3242694 RepID=A0ABV4TZG8_9GAMM